MGRLVAVLAAAGLAIGGLALAPVATADQPAAGPVSWGDCTDAVLKGAGAQCALLTVPLDYRNPGGPTIQLAISRIRHTSPDSQYQGVMLVNPGGPGASGLELSSLGQYVPDGVGGDYDWIGFDPRGVGASVPALSCDPGYFNAPRPNFVTLTPDLQQAWLAKVQGYAQACGRAQPGLLAHLSTIDSAHDLDSIRAALGADQISYYGFSYGTYLGQVYATLFPQRVHRLVLDSNVNPRDVWYQTNLNQDTAFNRNIDLWFGWVAKYDNVFHLGSTTEDVQRLYYQSLRSVADHPAGGVLGPDEFTDVFLQAAYYRFGWTDIAFAWSDWIAHSDPSSLIGLYKQDDTPGNDNSYAVYLGVQCTDAQWPVSWRDWERDNWRLYAAAPFETWDNAWFNAPCISWPAPAGTPVQVDGGKVSSALLIDETLDGATPFEGSLEVRDLFPGSSLIAEPGGATHADSLFGDSCVDDKISAYLKDGTLPARQPGELADVNCRPLADPVPSPSGPAPSGSRNTTQAAPEAGQLNQLLRGLPTGHF